MLLYNHRNKVSKTNKKVEQEIEEQTRLIKFLSELDQILQENVGCVIDEQGQPIEHNITEETIYNWMMETEEHRLLISEKGKVHTSFYDRL